MQQWETTDQEKLMMMRNGVDLLFRLGQEVAKREFMQGYEDMAEWIAENALADSFRQGYVETWRCLKGLASLNLRLAETNGSR